MSEVMKSSRTHDREIYLKEDRYREPKQYFLRMKEFLKQANLPAPGALLADFGCATGEFLYFISEAFPQAKCLGFDVIPEFLEQGKRRVPRADFRPGSVTDRSLLPQGALDVAFCMGVHSIFDDVESWLDNLLFWVKPGGRAYVFGLFNDYPIDVLVKYRHVPGAGKQEAGPSPWEAGWNIFSQKHVSGLLEKRGAASHTFHPFEMPFDLPPHAEDRVRTWTVQDQQGRRSLTNGLHLLCPFYFLEIVR